LLQRAAAGFAGVGRNRQAMAAAIRVVGESSGEGERGESEGGTGLGRFDRPRTQSVGLDPARWAGLANGPRPNFKLQNSVFKIIQILN
jgi:hypothetical protein